MLTTARERDRRKRSSWLIALSLLFSTAVVFAAQSPARATISVNVFAGTGTAGFSGDGSAATSAQLNQPQGLATDSVGNVYLVDASNRRIRKVSPAGTISTMTGDGSWCATSGLGEVWSFDTAGLCYPSWLAGVPGGSVYLNNGGWLDEVYLSGTKAHVAGKVDGNYYPADGNAFGVNVNPSTATVGGDGTVYFGESGTNSLKAWNPATGLVATIAGLTNNATCNYYASDGQAALGACIYPSYPVFSGNSLYFFDAAPGWRGPVIFRIDLGESPMHLHKVAGSGSWSDYGSGGLAVNAGLSSMGPLAVSSTGEIYLGNTNHGVIRKVDSSGYMRDVVNVGAREGALAFDSGDNLYASLPYQNQIMKVTGLGPAPTGKTIVALGDSVAAGEGVNYGFVWNPATSQWVQSGPSNPSWTDTTAATGANYQACHQSDYAHSRYFAPRYTVYNMACTGASAQQGVLGVQGVTDPDNGSFTGVLEQLGWGGDPASCSSCAPASTQFDAHNPDIVLLTVGADDISFASWVKACYGDLTACNTPDNQNQLDSQLGTEKANLRLVLTELNRWSSAKGKILRVVVTNYYDPYQSPYASCVDTSGAGMQLTTYPWIGITGDEQSWLVNGLISLNANINAEVNYARNNDSNLSVSLVDLSGIIAGHEFCTGDPWVYGPSINFPPFGGGPKFNPAPFHLTPQGQYAAYKAIYAALNI